MTRHTVASATIVLLDSLLKLGDGNYEALSLMKGEYSSQKDDLHDFGRSTLQK